MKKFGILICILLFISIYPLSAAGNFVVVIDAGHGGADGGAVRGKYKEKDINLAVALNFGKLIEDNYSDVKVIYTRKSDVKVDLYKRADIGNKAKANLFVSIHTNSTADKSTSASGADTYILGLARSDENRAAQQRENSVILLEDNYKQRYQGFDPNSPESYIIFEFMTNKFMEQSLNFANLLQENFKSVARRPDKGVKQAGFLVLRETAMPSVLIELGFINNSDEARYLSSTIGQRSLASAIFAGFKQYKKEFDNNQGFKNIVSNNSTQTEEPAFVSKPSQPLSQQPVAVSQQDTPPATTLSTEDNSTYVSKPKQDPVIAPRQKPTVPESAKNQDNISEKPAIKSDETEYRIQLLVADSELAPASPKLKGVSPLSFYVHNGAYKYTYGSTTDKNEAARLLREMKAKFKDAFIVEFRNGKRVK